LRSKIFKIKTIYATYKLFEQFLILLKFEIVLFELRHDPVNITFERCLNGLTVSVQHRNPLVDSLEYVHFIGLVENNSLQVRDLALLPVIYFVDILDLSILLVHLVNQRLVQLKEKLTDFRRQIKPKHVETLEVFGQIWTVLWNFFWPSLEFLL
jgi:hypothetical protein